MARKIILIQSQSPGDILTMTRPVGDLKLTNPDWEIDVRTPCPEIFENNPHLTQLEENDPEVEIYNIGYPKINDCGWEGIHFSDAFRLDIEDKLNSDPKKVEQYGITKIVKTGLRPELWMSDQEKSWFNQVHCEFFTDRPFWIINAGRKVDNELKQYAFWQDVVDEFNNLFQEKVILVQIGHSGPGHIHPKLKGVFSLVGQTSTRQLIRLMFNACGSVGPISFQFVISAAFGQPAVVVAGGKENHRWHGYDGIDYKNVIGKLDCCKYGGCWLGGIKGECKRLVKVGNVETPQCFTMITPLEIARSAYQYHLGGILRIPTNEETEKDRKTIFLLEKEDAASKIFIKKFGIHRVITINTVEKLSSAVKTTIPNIVVLGNVDNTNLVTSGYDTLAAFLHDLGLESKSNISVYACDEKWKTNFNALDVAKRIEYKPSLLEYMRVI